MGNKGEKIAPVLIASRWLRFEPNLVPESMLCRREQNRVATWRKSKCKGPGVGLCLGCLRESEVTGVAGAE